MPENIKLEINNIGPIHNASIDLAKLNIIGGANSSGKSTSSRLLFCFLFSSSRDGDDYYQNLIASTDNKASVSEDGASTDSMDRNEEFIEVMYKIFLSEFDYSPVDSDYGIGTASFKGTADENNNDFDWNLYVGQDLSGTEIEKNDENPVFLGNVVYLDSISPLEVIRLKDNLNIPYHFRSLFNKLSYKSDRKVSLEEKERLAVFQEKVNEILGGKFEYDFERESDDEKGFKFKRGDVSFSMKNSSSGLKQIGTIQMLLNNNQLLENDFLIIDEPQVNLHPEWQVKLAEILVLLVKELNITIYINSHSPHFIEALEVYSVKYHLEDETHFYMSELDEESNKYDLRELYYSNIRELYRNLGSPYDEINKVRLENNLRGLR